MAKAIIIRQIKYSPANPNSRQVTVDASQVLEARVIHKPGDEMDGRTVIILRTAGFGQTRKYTSESPEEIMRAVREALGTEESDSDEQDGSGDLEG